jgi:hypothetical protein
MKRVRTALLLAPVCAAVSLVGNCTPVLVEVDAGVPVGAAATVAVPTFAAAAGVARVLESGLTVWEQGAYVPGAPGVTGAVAGTAASGATVVQVLC